MSSYFQKKSGSRTQALASLREQMTASSNPKSNQHKDDERYWKPELDKTGTGSAVIRFLPGRDSDPFPYATLHTHGFQGPGGKWYIDNCPTSIGQECPACKANSALWNSGREEDKNLARSRKRKLSYISNILVVKDPKHPENEGKVFLYKYGKKVFEKIKDLLSPAFADQDPVNAFDPFEGANFKLRITKQDGFPNYDKSSFDASSPIFSGNEDKIAGLEGQLHSLEEVVSPAQFKTYDEYAKRLASVLGEASESSSRKSIDEDEDELVVAPRAAAKTAAARPQAAAKPKPAPVAVAAEDEADDDYFAKLAMDED
jgi:hypothetical protein